MTEIDQTPDEEGAIRFQVRLKNVNNTNVEYVNQIHADADKNDIQLVFSRLVSPIITSDQERVELASAGYLDATVVSRMVIPPAVVRSLIGVLAQMLDKQRQLAEAGTSEEIEGNA